MDLLSAGPFLEAYPRAQAVEGYDDQLRPRPHETALGRRPNPQLPTAFRMDYDRWPSDYGAVLGVIAFLCCAGGLGQIGFAYFAFQRQKETRNLIERAALDLTGSAKSRLDSGARASPEDETTAAADLSGAADYVRALADLAAKLAGLTPPVAALLISTILFLFAATLAAIGELHA